jgi:hypothetical protein
MPLALCADVLVFNMPPVRVRVGYPEPSGAAVATLTIVSASFIPTVIYQIRSRLAIEVALGALPMALGVVHVLSVCALGLEPSVTAVAEAGGC